MPWLFNPIVTITTFVPAFLSCLQEKGKACVKPLNHNYMLIRRLDPIQISILLLLTFSLNSCKYLEKEKQEEADPGLLAISGRVDSTRFDTLVNGKKTALFVLQNNKGTVLKLTNFGASMVQLIHKDRNGMYNDVILGYSGIEGYINDQMSLGCIVGPFANRIANARFSLNGKTFDLEKNNGENSLHSGPEGIHSVVWDAVQKDSSVHFSYTSPDMEAGFPGTQNFSVIYTLTGEDEIIIEYKATTSDSTFINLTNHTYWNLLGEAKGPILDHFLQVNANHITPVNDNLIPTGELMPVVNTPFDFTNARKIGVSIDNHHPQLKFGRGYDHNFVLDTEDRLEAQFAARVSENSTGRELWVYTTEPGIQIYSGNFMDGTVKGKNGLLYKYRHGIALEAQHFPDSPNQPAFPSTLLVPGQEYHQKTIYRLSNMPAE